MKSLSRNKNVSSSTPPVVVPSAMIIPKENLRSFVPVFFSMLHEFLKFVFDLMRKVIGKPTANRV